MKLLTLRSGSIDLYRTYEGPELTTFTAYAFRNWPLDLQTLVRQNYVGVINIPFFGSDAMRVTMPSYKYQELRDRLEAHNLEALEHVGRS